MKRVRSTEESQVFQSSGFFGPHPLAVSANETELKPPETTVSIIGLQPYIEHEFRVLAMNMAGNVSSAWKSERTGESGKDWRFEFY
jgi:hypothetical protein